MLAYISLLLLLPLTANAVSQAVAGLEDPTRWGRWDTIGHSGVSSMHAALLSSGKVVFLDKAAPWTYVQLKNGRYTFSAEFDPENGKVVPLSVFTNTFCSAGGFLPDGTLVNVGGAEAFRYTPEGYNSLRFLQSCDDKSLNKKSDTTSSQSSFAIHDDGDNDVYAGGSNVTVSYAGADPSFMLNPNATIRRNPPRPPCDWVDDPKTTLAAHRWYPAAVNLADGRLMIVGGSAFSAAVNTDHINEPSYEFYPPRELDAGDGVPGKKKSAPAKKFPMPFLKETMPFNLYPGLHLLPNGDVFVWANKKAMAFDAAAGKEKRRFPEIPGSPRSYPLTGSSVLLPLDPADNYRAEVIIFGGSEKLFKSDWIQSPGDKTLQRLDTSASSPRWISESMPSSRLMPDGVILADGTIFISNGAARGVAGYNSSIHVKATNPVVIPWIYNPTAKLGARFRMMARSRVPRLYHSVSLLLPDGRVLVSGSNPINKPTERPPRSLRWGTEYRVEAFSPAYFFLGRRQIELRSVPAVIRYRHSFTVRFRRFVSGGDDDLNAASRTITAALIHTGFVTHSNHMSQRYVKLVVRPVAGSSTQVTVTAPPTGAIAPPGPYMLFLLEGGKPCKRAEFVLLK